MHIEFVARACVGFLIISICAFTTFGEPIHLLTLWDGALKNDFSHASTITATREAQINREHTSTLYAPTVNIQAKTDISNTISGNFQIGVPFVGGLRLNSSINYGVQTIPSASTGVNKQSAGLQLSVSQSLQPYWAQNCREDPASSSLNLNLRTQQTMQASSAVNLLIQTTNLIIQLRSIERDIQYLQQSISFQREKLDSNRQLLRQGTISTDTIWQLEHDLWTDEQLLMTRQNSLFELRLQIQDSTGIRIGSPSDFLLPEIMVSQDYRKQQIGDWIPDIEQIVTTQESNRINAILRRQNQAPSISLGLGTDLSVPGTSTPSSIDSWNVSVTLDVSPVFNSTSIRDTALETERAQFLDSKLKYLMQQRKTKKETLELNIARLTQQKEQFDASLVNASQLYEDTKTVYLAGGISLLSLKTANLELTKRKMACEQNQDDLWYSQYLLTWYN